MAAAVLYDTFDGTLVSESRGATVTYYTSDTLGSLALCRNSSGTVTYTADYWPYGELRSSTGSNPSPWGFVGLLGYYTDSVSRIYVRMRHYLQKTTRWLTVDPLWPDQDAYSYELQSPVQLSDRSGLLVLLDPFGDPYMPTPAVIRGSAQLAWLALKNALKNPKRTWSDALRSCDPCIDGVQRVRKESGPAGIAAVASVGLNAHHPADGPGNAIAHCHSACEAAKQLGIGCATRGLDALEYWDPTGMFNGANQMDLSNNYIGVGLAADGMDCAAGCIYMYKMRALVWLTGPFEPSPLPLRPSVVPGGGRSGRGSSGGVFLP